MRANKQDVAEIRLPTRTMTCRTSVTCDGSAADFSLSVQSSERKQPDPPSLSSLYSLVRFGG